jgi:hypothetical protein
MLELVRRSELERTRRWLDETFLCPAFYAACFPVSFHLGAERATGVAPLKAWTVRNMSRVESGVRSEPVVFVNSQTGLECRCEIKASTDFPAVERVVCCTNTGETDTPLRFDIQPLDILLPVDARAGCSVHHARDSLTQTNDFTLLETPLTFRQGGAVLHLAASTRKSSTLHPPFFNLELGSGSGIRALGWTSGGRRTFSGRLRGCACQPTWSASI